MVAFTSVILLERSSPCETGVGNFPAVITISVYKRLDFVRLHPYPWKDWVPINGEFAG